MTLSVLSWNAIQGEPEVGRQLPHPCGPPRTTMDLLPPWLSGVSPGIQEEGHPCLPG